MNIEVWRADSVPIPGGELHWVTGTLWPEGGEVRRPSGELGDGYPLVEASLRLRRALRISEGTGHPLTGPLISTTVARCQTDMGPALVVCAVCAIKTEEEGA